MTDQRSPLPLPLPLPAGMAFLVLLVLAAPAFAQERPGNPLGELFRNIDRRIREGAEEVEQSRTGKDQLDLRLPQRPEDQRRLRQAREMIQNERWHEAVDLLQYLLEQPEDAFLASGPEEPLSLHEMVEETIRQLPADGRRNYLNRYGAAAQTLLNEARQTQNEARLVELSRRFLNTPAGQEALEILARLWEDRGELVSASRAWQRLAMAGEQPGRRERHARRGAVLLARTGQLEQARRLSREMGIDRENFLLELETTEILPAPQPEDGPPFVSSEATRPRSRIEPLLVPDWSVRTAERYSVQQQVRALLKDLKDQDRALVPIGRPLAVSGKVAFRTLRSLHVRDLTSGETLWEKRVENSPEELLTPGRSSEAGSEIAPYTGAMFEHHQLASLLFRDSLYGTLTSDGRHLFAVESDQPLAAYSSGYAWRRVRDPQSEMEGWSTNEIAAYDLRTGLVRWRIGGTEIEERFSRPLAGTFFFGPPTAEGDDLFVVGEQAGEVMLFCLSARTGEVNWSQTLATPSRPIGEDLLRRFWACQPLLEQGLILCPTTTGWLVALDRQTRQLQWAARYSPRVQQSGRFRGGMLVQSLQEINRRWPSSPPIGVGDRLLVAPAELPDEFNATQDASFLICLDIATGKQLWTQPKETGLHVAGVFANRAILVNKESVLAREITADGRIAWQVSLESDQPPSGHGVIADGKLYLPLGLKSLLTIDLRQGEIIDRATLAAGDAHLGNLLLHREMLVSLSPLDVTAFPAGRARPDPAAAGEPDLPMQIRRAELLVANQEFHKAYERLQEITGSATFSSLPEIQQRQVHRLEWRSLVHLVEDDLRESAGWLERMERLAATAEEKLTYQRLDAERMRRLGDWEPALEGYLDLLQAAPRETTVSEGSREIRIAGWTGGRLQSLFVGLPVEGKSEFVGQIRKRFATLPEDSPWRNDFARALGFHPLGQEFELELAAAARSRKRFGEAFLRLQRAALSPQPELSQQANRSLKELLEEQGLSRPASRGGEIPQRCWGDRWEVARTGSGAHREGVSAVSTGGDPFSSLGGTRWLYDMQSLRLRVEDADARPIWSLPLKSTSAQEHNPNVGVHWLGSTALVMHRGVLHALRFPEKEVAWTYTPHVDGLEASRLRTPSRRHRYTMQTPNSFAGSHRLGSNRGTAGYMLAANPHALLVLTRELTALDPLTGEELWRARDADPTTVAHAYGNHFLIAANAREEARLIDSLDGAAHFNRWLSSRHRQTIEVIDRDLVLMAHGGGKRPWTLKRETPEGDGPDWQLEVPADALVGRTGPDALCWLGSDGTLHRVDLATGAQIELGQVPEELMSGKRQVSLLSDGSRYYLVIDAGTSHASYVSLASIRTSGSVVAFDRDGGGLAWRRSVDSLWKETGNEPKREEEKAEPSRQRWSMNLLTEDFEQNPLLLLAADRPDPRGDVYFRNLRLVGLDKTTGEPVVQWGRPSDSGGFSYLQVNLADRFVELRTHAERLRIRPVEDERVEEDAGKG